MACVMFTGDTSLLFADGTHKILQHTEPVDRVMHLQHSLHGVVLFEWKHTKQRKD